MVIVYMCGQCETAWMEKHTSAGEVPAHIATLAVEFGVRTLELGYLALHPKVQEESVPIGPVPALPEHPCRVLDRQIHNNSAIIEKVQNHVCRRPPVA